MKNLLIVDDDVIMNNSIKAMLSDTYHIFQLTSGTQVMDFLKKKETDLVLLDVYMHDMDGIEVMRLIKEDSMTAKIPVIFLTGDESADLEAQCLQLGAADFVHKPISRSVLEQRVANHLMAADSYKRIRQMYESANQEAVISKHIVRHDELTGLWNRQHIYEMFANIMDNPDSQCALAFVDIDNFKCINEMLGHQESDAILKRFAGVLQSLEETGIIPARIGGDEFMLLMPNITNPSQVQELSDYIFEKSSHQVLTSDETCVFTFSMGVAFAPGDGENFENLAAMADMGLQKAKSLGKNRVYFAKNLNISNRQRELSINSGKTKLKHVFQGRRSDKRVMVIQFGEMRILYSSLKRMPQQIADETRAIMFTIAPEDSNPIVASRLMTDISDNLLSVVSITQYAQNQIIALAFGMKTDELEKECTKIIDKGSFGSVKYEIL